MDELSLVILCMRVVSRANRVHRLMCLLCRVPPPHRLGWTHAAQRSAIQRVAQHSGLSPDPFPSNVAQGFLSSGGAGSSVNQFRSWLLFTIQPFHYYY